MSLSQGHLAEGQQIVAMQVPVDAGGGAVASDWVNMANFNHLEIVFVADIGTTGEDPVITVLQATDNSGTGSKDLDFNTYYTKEGATAISAIGEFTKTTQTGSNTATSGSGGENEQLVVIPIDAMTLDHDNDFTHVSVTIADPGVAGKLISLLGILTEPRYPQEPSRTAID